MSGQNQQFGSRSGRFGNLDCPVEVGEPCVMPLRPETGEGQPKKWLNWEVNPTYLVALAGIIVSLFVWGGGPNGVNTQLSNLAIIVKQQDKEKEALNEKIKENERRVESQLVEMNRKLDRLIERGR